MASCVNCRTCTEMGRSYCLVCSALPQCRVCGKREHRRYFVDEPDVCIVCSSAGPRRQRALRETVAEVKLPTSENDNDVARYVADHTQEIAETVQDALDRHTSIKFQVTVAAKFVRSRDDGSTQETTAYFVLEPAVLGSIADLDL